MTFNKGKNFVFIIISSLPSIFSIITSGKKGALTWAVTDSKVFPGLGFREEISRTAAAMLAKLTFNFLAIKQKD